MGTISVTTFLSLDGVMQAPGGPDEDRASGFTLGGWLTPFDDVAFNDFVGPIFERPEAFLLGRKTYDIFASYWPTAPAEAGTPLKLNVLHKYVVTKNPKLPWGPASAVGSDLEKETSALKAKHAGEIQVHGSAQLARSLLDLGLVDRLNLVIAPVTLGRGKRLFGEAMPSTWKLIDSRHGKSGLTFATYEKGGEVKTGSFT